jgi:2-(1,2-epoxy-1,2-dihydrophenyl)acetyl-CoA isomerase
MELPKELLFEKQDGVAILTLNRPEKFNALNPNLRDGIGRICKEVSRDDGVRVMIITGAGKAFCSGADLSTRLKDQASGAILAASGAETAETRRSITEPIGHYSLAIRNLEKPVIAAVNGIASGGGLGIVLACDIRVASEKARFSAIWVKRGLVPDAGASYFLPRIVGFAKACELIFKGHIINANEAEQMGMVNLVVPHDELMARTRELAAQIAQNAPIALEWAKKILSMGLNNNLESQLYLESAAQRICNQSEDFKEGIRSFMEKRPAVFKGK